MYRRPISPSQNQNENGFDEPLLLGRRHNMNMCSPTPIQIRHAARLPISPRDTINSPRGKSYGSIVITKWISIQNIILFISALVFIANLIGMMTRGYYHHRNGYSTLLGASNMPRRRVVNLHHLNGGTTTDITTTILNCLSFQFRLYFHGRSMDLPSNYFFEMGQQQQQHSASSSTSKTTEAGREEEYGTCLPKESWHTLNFVNCNTFHEIDHANSLLTENHIQYIAKGAGRSTWLLQRNKEERIAFKTLNYQKLFSQHTFQSQRIDALVSERLTRSPYVIDVYGYCGMSTLNEFANRGRFGLHYMANVANYTSMDKYIYARDISRGLADVHEIDSYYNNGKNGSTVLSSSSVVHHDFSPKNLLLTSDNKVKISDFNNARLMRFDTKRNTPCMEFKWDHLCGTTIERTHRRSPEECLMSLNEERATRYLSSLRRPPSTREIWNIITTERTEVWHLGTILHFLLTEEEFPYRFEKHMLNGTPYLPSIDAVKEMILAGKKPPIPREIEHSNDPAIRALVIAMERAFTMKMKSRPSARDIANMIDEKIVEEGGQVVVG